MSGYSADPRIRWTEWLPWIAAIAFFFLLPGYLSLGARILIFILFALSLDLILGYAGIVTLGHSAFFGLGAYTAGALGAHTGVTDPFAQLAAAAALSALLGLEPSGDILVMLILGGVGRLYGAFIGPVVYLIAQDYLAKQYPEYWYFGIGTLLIAVVLFTPGGILGLMDKWLPFFKQKSSARASAR